MNYLDNLENLVFEEGSSNSAGIADVVYYIPKAHLQDYSFPKIKSTITAAADIVTLDGSFVLETAKFFKKIHCTQGKGKGDFEGTGEVEGKIFTNKLALSFPKNTAEVRAFAKLALNTDMVYVVPETNGKFFVIGDPFIRTTTTPAGTTGDEPGSAHGVTFEVSCASETPFPVYEGEVVMEDKTLDCATGLMAANV